MNHRRLCKPSLLAAILCAWAWCISPADAAFLYKSYQVKQDRGREILCDPYIVRKNDYVLKLFRQKGEISAEDFPEFLAVFKRINPHIRDINLVRPGQQIFIPLRVLRSNEMPGQATGVVTIPYVTISRTEKAMEDHIRRYRVQQGDCVSKLIASRFGRYGSASYWEGVRLFRLMNPTVTDLDRIYAGQVLRLPEASAKDAPWYAAAVGQSGPSSQEPPQALDPSPPVQHRSSPEPVEPPNPLVTAADALGAVLLDHGTYFFPRPGGGDFRLDLSRVPALEFADGRLALLPEIHSPALAELETFDPIPEKTDIAPISRNWGAQRIVEAVLAKTGRARPTDRLVVSDSGIRMEIHARWITGRTIDDTGEVGRVCILPLKDCGVRTPEPIVRYLEEQDILLREICEEPGRSVRHSVGAPPTEVHRIEAADRRSFVKEVLTALGCEYASNVSISFPYAGTQVRAQTNLAAFPDGREYLIDFGDLYGDAISAIEQAGFSVVQIETQDRRNILGTLLDALDRPYVQDPTLMAAEREGPYNVAVTFIGFLVENGSKERLLIAESPLHHRLVDFLYDRGVRVVQLGLVNRPGIS